MKPVPPCRDCITRKMLCHQSCKKYLLYKSELESYKSYVKEYEIRANTRKLQLLHK